MVVFSVAEVWTAGGEGNRLRFEDSLFFSPAIMCVVQPQPNFAMSLAERKRRPAGCECENKGV